MTRNLGVKIGALMLGAVAGYGVSVAIGAPEDFDAGLRSGTDRGKEQLVLLLQRKEESLNRREQTIGAREADVRAAEEQVERRIKELQELREQIRASLEDLDGDREERIVGLVKMFESMRPKQAAGILTVTEDDIALEVLERMNRTKAGKALAAMEPKRAAFLAERIGKAALLAK
jgi:flagellar motility protein MotE (MotC chaperone)